MHSVGQKVFRVKNLSNEFKVSRRNLYYLLIHLVLDIVKEIIKMCLLNLWKWICFLINGKMFYTKWCKSLEKFCTFVNYDNKAMVVYHSLCYVHSCLITPVHKQRIKEQRDTPAFSTLVNNSLINEGQIQW